MDNNSPALPTNEKKAVDVNAAEEMAKRICPEFKVSGVFSSDMVLQQNAPIKIWGLSDMPGSNVYGIFENEKATAVVRNDNTWYLEFQPRKACKTGRQITIYDDRNNKTEFKDVLIGDVWLIGGQSNAELNMMPCMTVTPDFEIRENEQIRLFAQTQAYVFGNQDYCLFPQPDIINPDWRWRKPSRDAVMAFSAMGFYFAREIYEHIDIPVGMIMMAAGGACIRELMPEELAHDQGYFFGANVRESGYYNTLIHPFAGIRSRGMLFFQGESEGLDRGLAERYDKDLALLVEDERRRFGYDFPFYNVQLSDYRSEGAACFRWLDIIRMKQFDALSIIPNSTLTVDMDLGAPEGYPDWAHSPRKAELGHRLASLALAREYGIGTIDKVSSPVPLKAVFSANENQINIIFTDICGGLSISDCSPEESIGKEVQGFSIGGYDDKVPVRAVITASDTVTLYPTDNICIKTSPTYINYAFFLVITDENANLHGGNGLPAPAFSIILST